MDESWRKVYRTYDDAFNDWKVDVQACLKDNLEGAFRIVFNEPSIDGWEQLRTRERQDLELGRYIDLWQVAVAIDLLVLAISELPSSIDLGIELAGLDKLRGYIVQQVMTLHGGVLWHTGSLNSESIASSAWTGKTEGFERIRQRTMYLLHELNEMRLIQDSLTNELEAFEKRLKIATPNLR